MFARGTYTTSRSRRLLTKCASPLSLSESMRTHCHDLSYDVPSRRARALVYDVLHITRSLLQWHLQKQWKKTSAFMPRQGRGMFHKPCLHFHFPAPAVRMRYSVCIFCHSSFYLVCECGSLLTQEKRTPVLGSFFVKVFIRYDMFVTRGGRGLNSARERNHRGLLRV